MKDSIADGVKVVKWVFAGIKQDELINVQSGAVISIDDEKIPVHVIIHMPGRSAAILFAGDISEAEDRFERIARRLGAVDLLQEAGADELAQAVEAVRTAGPAIVNLGRQLKAIRAAAAPLLKVLDGHPERSNGLYTVLGSELFALRAALEGAEGVDDD